MLISWRGVFILMTCLCSTTVYGQTGVEIAIEGIDKTLEQNVRLFLSIEQQKSHPLLNEGRLQRLHRKALEEISAALQPYGYYRPRIESSLTRLENDEWRASYNIDPGPALAIAEFNFTISEEMGADQEFQTLIEAQRPQTGAVFNHLVYENFKAGLSRLAAERGYISANFIQHRVEIDLNDYVARVYLNIDGGPRHHFGEVTFEQTVLNEDLIKRYIPFQKGDPYAVDQLVDLQQALNDSDYFQSVEITPGQAAPDNEIPIRVKLTPRKKHRFNFGIGYGSDTGARTKIGWQRPRINRRGHRFDSEARISELGYDFIANYRVPIFNPRTDQIVYSLGQVREEFESSISTVRNLGVSLRHSRGEWREIVSLNYQQEDFVVADDAGSTRLFIPGISWSRTWGKGFIHVLDGVRFDISLRGASKDLGSDLDFAQLNGSLKFITPLGQKYRVITRGGLGRTSTQEFDQLPSSLRFFSGGGQSVRGYAYQSLGPKDINGEVEGAKHLVFGSIELERSLNDRWGLALFYDAGNAINDFRDDLERGAGFGLRWKSPVGPVRIDIANAISTEERDWRLHVNIGPDL